MSLLRLKEDMSFHQNVCMVLCISYFGVMVGANTLDESPIFYVKESRHAAQNNSFQISPSIRNPDIGFIITFVCSLRHVIKDSALINITIESSQRGILAWYDAKLDLAKLVDDKHRDSASHAVIAKHHHQLELKFPCSLGCIEPGRKCSMQEEGFSCGYCETIANNRTKCTYSTSFNISEVTPPWFEIKIRNFDDEEAVDITDRLIFFNGVKTIVSVYLVDYNGKYGKKDEITIFHDYPSLAVRRLRNSKPRSHARHCGQVLLQEFVFFANGVTKIENDIPIHFSLYVRNPPIARGYYFNQTLLANIYTSNAVNFNGIAMQWLPPPDDFSSEEKHLIVKVPGIQAEACHWLFMSSDVLFKVQPSGILDDVKHLNISEIQAENDSLTIRTNLPLSQIKTVNNSGLALHLIVIVFTTTNQQTMETAWIRFAAWTFYSKMKISIDNAYLTDQPWVIKQPVTTMLHTFKCRIWCSDLDSYVSLDFVNKRVMNRRSEMRIVPDANLTTNVAGLDGGFIREQQVNYPGVLFDGSFLGECNSRCGHFWKTGNEFNLTVYDPKCVPNPCLNGGACIVSGDEYRCLCAITFDGVNCENARKCTNEVCENGGTCLYNLTGNGTIAFRCVCPYPYRGDKCLYKVERERFDVCVENDVCTAVVSSIGILASLAAIFAVDIMSGRTICRYLRGHEDDSYLYLRYKEALENVPKDEQFYDDSIITQRKILMHAFQAGMTDSMYPTYADQPEELFEPL